MLKAFRGGFAVIVITIIKQSREAATLVELVHQFCSNVVILHVGVGAHGCWLVVEMLKNGLCDKVEIRYSGSHVE